MSDATATSAPSGAAPRLTALQWRVISLCALVAFLDGFDTQAIGPAAKAISVSLHLPMSVFGLVFSASQAGFIVGAMLFSALGDRFGRKRLLIAGTVVFGLCSLGTALCQSFDGLIAFRLLAGLGLGGASPNFVSLASEYSPPAQRARVVTTLWAAVPFGGMCAAFVSAAILPTLGWRAVFEVGFAAPALLALLLVWALPESREVGGPAQPTAPPKAPIAALFAEGRGAMTAWLWLGSFMTWTALIVMAFWTPALLQRAGWSASAAANVLALNNAGGVAGTLATGALLTRIRPTRALIGALVFSSLFIAAIGLATRHAAWLPPLACLAGVFASAAGGALLAVSAAAYPESARATGVGWALGVGRVGAVVGPSAMGLLVAAGWPTRSLYFVLSVPFLAAAVLIVLMVRATATAGRANPLAVQEPS